MQEFVIRISASARRFDPDFIIVPQNGMKLAFHHTDPKKGFHTEYLSSIDGLGVEELFYRGERVEDDYRLSLLGKFKGTKTIMVSEYVREHEKVLDAYDRNVREGFIAFVREADNYHYGEIPESIFESNDEAIIHLSQAKNWLYLISTDHFSTKEEMIKAIKATNYDVILIDLFFQGSECTPQEVVQLKRKPNGKQKLVLSYVNIGAAEKFRYYWQPQWRVRHPSWMEKEYPGYDDEY